MNETVVTTPNEHEIRVERVFDAPHAQVFTAVARYSLSYSSWRRSQLMG